MSSLFTKTTVALTSLALAFSLCAAKITHAAEGKKSTPATPALKASQNGAAAPNAFMIGAYPVTFYDEIRDDATGEQDVPAVVIFDTKADDPEPERLMVKIYSYNRDTVRNVHVSRTVAADDGRIYPYELIYTAKADGSPLTFREAKPVGPMPHGARNLIRSFNPNSKENTLGFLMAQNALNVFNERADHVGPKGVMKTEYTGVDREGYYVVRRGISRKERKTTTQEKDNVLTVGTTFYDAHTTNPSKIIFRSSFTFTQTDRHAKRGKKYDFDKLVGIFVNHYGKTLGMPKGMPAAEKHRIGSIFVACMLLDAGEADKHTSPEAVSSIDENGTFPINRYIKVRMHGHKMSVDTIMKLNEIGPQKAFDDIRIWQQKLGLRSDASQKSSRALHMLGTKGKYKGPTFG